MTVTVEFLGYQKMDTGLSTIEVSETDYALAEDVLQHVASLFPKLYLDKEPVIITVNGQKVLGDRKLNAGDIINFVPILGGG